MGIYIKGMEMPTSCAECFNRVCGLGREVALPTHQRHKYCPLISVPPHGDLIDRDDAEAIAYMDEDVGRDFADGILFAADWIRQRPTIIPASEEGET